MNRAASDRHTERAEPSASVDTLESLLAANRAALDHTLSELGERVSTEDLFHEAMELLRGLRDAVLRNPLPVTLTAIGLAWTAVAYRRSRAGPSGTRPGAEQEQTAGVGTAEAQDRKWAKRGDEALDRARERAGRRGQDAAERTRRSVTQARDLAREHPILMVGTGLLLGAALAALLPATQAESEEPEPAEDRARREARKATDTGAEGAKGKSAGRETGGDREQPPGSGDGTPSSTNPVTGRLSEQ